VSGTNSTRPPVMLSVSHPVPAVSWFLPELRRLLRAEFAGAYRPVAHERGWSLDFMRQFPSALDEGGARLDQDRTSHRRDRKFPKALQIQP
jgi:hypothetical protein